MSKKLAIPDRQRDPSLLPTKFSMLRAFIDHASQLAEVLGYVEASEDLRAIHDTLREEDGNEEARG